MKKTAASDAPVEHSRRAPTQQRSRDRVERILAAAASIIEEAGSDAMRMSDLAERSEVSIGSLYQYFPDKSAVIRTLAERYNVLGRACIAEELAGIENEEELEEAFGRLVDIYYAMFLDEPVMRDIWFGLQADKGLRAFELAESRANGDLLADAMARVHPDADQEQSSRSAFLIMSLGETTMRLAISVGRKEGDALVEAYKRMAQREIRAPGGPS